MNMIPNPYESPENRAQPKSLRCTYRIPWILLVNAGMLAIFGVVVLVSEAIGNQGMPRRYASYVSHGFALELPSLVVTPTTLAYIAIGTSVGLVVLSVARLRKREDMH